MANGSGRPPGEQQTEAGEKVTERLEFLLATRIRYELHQRTSVPGGRRALASDANDERADSEPDLRAAEFLLAARALREANERALRHEPPDAPPP